MLTSALKMLRFSTFRGTTAYQEPRREEKEESIIHRRTKEEKYKRKKKKIKLKLEEKSGDVNEFISSQPP